MKFDILQLYLKGGVYSIDGTKAVVDSMTTTLPAESEPSNKKVSQPDHYVNAFYLTIFQDRCT